MIIHMAMRFTTAMITWQNIHVKSGNTAPHQGLDPAFGAVTPRNVFAMTRILARRQPVRLRIPLSPSGSWRLALPEMIWFERFQKSRPFMRNSRSSMVLTIHATDRQPGAIRTLRTAGRARPSGGAMDFHSRCVPVVTGHPVVTGEAS
jgi:hypothetical protein